MWLANGVIDAMLRARGFLENRPWVASVSESRVGHRPLQKKARTRELLQPRTALGFVIVRLASQCEFPDG